MKFIEERELKMKRIITLSITLLVLLVSLLGCISVETKERYQIITGKWNLFQI